MQHTYATAATYLLVILQSGLYNCRLAARLKHICYSLQKSYQQHESLGWGPVTWASCALPVVLDLASNYGYKILAWIFWQVMLASETNKRYGEDRDDRISDHQKYFQDAFRKLCINQFFKNTTTQLVARILKRKHFEDLMSLSLLSFSQLRYARIRPLVRCRLYFPPFLLGTMHHHERLATGT